MPDDRPWRINKKGKPPRGTDEDPVPGDTLIDVEWANGTLSRRPYQIQQLTWELDRGEFSIAKYRRSI